MFCKNCGKKNEEDEKFCGKCGIKVLDDEKQTSLSHNRKQIEDVGAIKFPRIGRLGRFGFTISMIISFAIIILLALSDAPLGVLMTFVYINMAWMFIIYTGRLHDTGHSGWYSILFMFVSLLGIIALALWSGEKKANKYGEVPPGSPSHLLYFWRIKR